MRGIGQGVQQTACVKDQNGFCYLPQHPAELSSVRLRDLAPATSTRPNGMSLHMGHK